MRNYYVPGDWNAICDQCGRKFKASTLRKRWDNLMVCPEDFETRHPQEFVRAVRDNFPLPFVRHEPPDGVHPNLPALNCSVLTFTYEDRDFYNTLTTDWSVTKTRTNGVVTIPDGITITVLCTWEIE